MTAVALVPFSIAYGLRPSSSIMTAGVYVDAARHGEDFIAANRWGIELFETGNDGELISISRAFTSGQAEFLDIENDLVAVSNFDGSVEFFRIENRRFTRAGWLELDFHPLNLKIIGEHLYIGGAERPLVVYNISDPSQPVFVTEVPFTGYGFDFKVRNDSMFIAAYHGGVVIIDISDKSDPVVLEQYFMPDYVYGLEIDSSYVYVCAHQSGLYVLDLRYNGQPPIIGHNGDFGSARKAGFVDGCLAVLDLFGALKLIDLSRRSLPETIWSLPLDFNCYGMGIRDDTVFVANWIHGVKCIKIDGKSGARILSERTQYSICRSIIVDNGRILAAAGKGGLIALDQDLKPISTPDFNIEGNCVEIKKRGDKGYLSYDDYGLGILDLKDDGDIVGISFLKTEGWVQSSTSGGQYAFLANWQGIMTVDLADIEYPVVDGFYDTDFASRKIEFRNDTVFVAGTGGLELYDTADPRNIEFLNRFPTDYPSLNLSLNNELVILSSGIGGVDLVSLAEGLAPVSHIFTAGTAYDAEIAGSKLFVAEEDSGVTIWEISDIDQPQFLARFDVAGKAYDMAFKGNRVYLADYYGISMLELPWEDVYNGEDVDEVREPGLKLYPNPVVGRASVLIDNGAPGMIDVELFDILGRKVKTLYEGYSRGNSIVNWEKENLPSGCYYVRVKGNGFVETRQVTLLK